MNDILSAANLEGTTDSVVALSTGTPDPSATFQSEKIDPSVLARWVADGTTEEQLLPPKSSPINCENYQAKVQLLPGKTEAYAEGDFVVRGFRAGTHAVIEACARTAAAVERFGDDDAAVDDFLSALVGGNLISRSEARLGRSSPKLTKFRKIGANAELLGHGAVFRFLMPGYTVAYHVTVLYDVLDGDEACRFEQLVRELEALSPISRERLIARTGEIKRAKKGASSLPSSSDAGVTSYGEPSGQPGRVYELVLLTPDRQRDLWRLSEDYDAYPEFLRRGNALLAEDAVAVVISRLADMPLIKNKLLLDLGFSHVSQICLIRVPKHADVIGAEVLIVARRTSTDFASNFTWLAETEALDAKALVDRLAPDAGKKLHLFASEESEGSSGGWLSVVGNANWGQADE